MIDTARLLRGARFIASAQKRNRCGFPLVPGRPRRLFGPPTLSARLRLSLHLTGGLLLPATLIGRLVAVAVRALPLFPALGRGSLAAGGAAGPARRGNRHSDQLFDVAQECRLFDVAERDRRAVRTRPGGAAD